MYTPNDKLAHTKNNSHPKAIVVCGPPSFRRRAWLGIMTRIGFRAVSASLTNYSLVMDDISKDNVVVVNVKYSDAEITKVLQNLRNHNFDIYVKFFGVSAFWTYLYNVYISFPSPSIPYSFFKSMKKAYNDVDQKKYESLKSPF